MFPCIFNNSVETPAPLNVVIHPRCCEPINYSLEKFRFLAGIEPVTLGTKCREFTSCSNTIYASFYHVKQLRNATQLCFHLFEVMSRCIRLIFNYVDGAIFLFQIYNLNSSLIMQCIFSVFFFLLLYSTNFPSNLRFCVVLGTCASH